MSAISEQTKLYARNAFMYSANGAAWTRAMCDNLVKEARFDQTMTSNWFADFLKFELRVPNLTTRYLNPDQMCAYASIRKRISRYFEALAPKAAPTQAPSIPTTAPSIPTAGVPAVGQSDNATVTMSQAVNFDTALELVLAGCKEDAGLAFRVYQQIGQMHNF